MRRKMRFLEPPVVVVVAVLIATATLVESCQHGCICTSNFVAVCRGSSLRSVPILLDPRTTVLDLSDNRIGRLSADELALYPNLEELILRNNSLTHLNPEVFASLANLRVLDLSHNSLLSLPNRVFDKLKNLKRLSVASNDVQLSAECLSGLTSLEWLSLADNRLAFLPQAVLRPLNALRHLDLAANKLLTMPGSVISSLVSLRSLNLRHNLISSLETGTFAALKELHWLDLSANLIGDIEESAFYGLEQLAVLNLTENQLVRLPGNTWPLPQLRVLDLSSNLFVSLETASFDSLPNLKYLNISNSRNLKSVQMAAFVSLTSLEWLSLASSALQRFHPSSFSPHPPLKHFDVSSNQLTTLAIGLLQFDKVRVLRLDGNHWQCDCALRSLRLAPSDAAMCASPEDVVGAALGDVRECTMLGGLMMPIALAAIVLALALIVLALACKRPPRRKSRAFYNESLINVLSHKELVFDRTHTLSSPYTTSEDNSSDSAYESPTSALVPRRPPPTAPPRMVLPRAASSSPPRLPTIGPPPLTLGRHDHYMVPNDRYPPPIHAPIPTVPMTRL